MRNAVRAAAVLVLVLLAGGAAQAQTPPPVPQEPMTLTADRGFGTPAVVVENAPIYLLPDSARLPLRIARPGSQLRVLQQTGEWANVQFEDPQYGLRTGYVQSRFLRSSPPSATDSPAAPTPLSDRPENGQRRSESAGVFVGGGFEWNRIMPNDDTLASAPESGPGVGIIAGFGFSPHWSVYGELSVARIDAVDFSGTYTLTHFDVGTRVHFPSAARRATPFLQVALAGRAVSQTYSDPISSHSLSASGPGVSFGGGVNVHVTPALALSGSASWMVGNFSTYKLDSQTLDADSLGATSVRVLVGVVWFPRGAR